MLRGKPSRSTEKTLHGPNRIEAGWLVVAAQWLRLENSECEGGLRSYSLLDAETLFLINHTVRLSGMTLSQGKGGPAGRALRSKAIAAPPILSAKKLTTRLSLAALRINASKVVVAA